MQEGATKTMSTPQQFKEAVNHLLSNMEASQLYVEMAINEKDNLIQRKVERFAEDSGHEYHLRGGDFVTACWNGNIEKAFYRADYENLPVVEEIVGESKEEYLGW